MVRSPSILIIGTGFAGICMAISLRRAGFENFRVLERGDAVGGVWRDNRYPGAACDVPTPLYSYSFETDYPFSTAYAGQREMQDYIRHCAIRHGLMERIAFGADVRAAAFDEGRQHWSVRCADGREFTADILISAIGIFNEPVIPAIEGAARFGGPQFHSARWRDDVALEGRRVGVIGGGASAVQIVPELVRVAAAVYSFQRSPAYVLPRKVVDMENRASERQRIFREFDEFASRRRSLALVQQSQAFFEKHIEAEVPDAHLRKALTPSFVFGCKRTLFSDDWYAALQHPHAHPVFDAIEAIDEQGVRLRGGGAVALDAIVYATGFNAAAYLSGIEVVARGQRLADAWQPGAEAHLGISVAGFPNLFLMYGPNTNVGGSVVHVHECQAHYILQCLEAMLGREARRIEVRAEAMRRWCDDLQRQLRESVMDAAHCRSYSMNGAGRVVTNYPGTQTEYQKETERMAVEDFAFR